MELSCRGSGLAASPQQGPRDEVAARRCASLGVAEGSKAVAETRKLAAILAAVGFSKLAGSDEERTLARLRALRSELIDPPSPSTKVDLSRCEHDSKPVCTRRLQVHE
jgi:hypothetical protein